MDEHHGKSAGPIWAESEPACVGSLIEEITDQETAQLARPESLVAQAIGKRGGTVDLERNILSVEADRLDIRRGVDLQGGIQGSRLPAVCERRQCAALP